MWKFLLLTFLALAKADVWDENSSGEPRRNYYCHVKCGVTEARRAEGAKRFKIFLFQFGTYCQSSNVKIVTTVKRIITI